MSVTVIGVDARRFDVGSEGKSNVRAMSGEVEVRCGVLDEVEVFEEEGYSWLKSVFQMALMARISHIQMFDDGLGRHTY
jgi:hypothetical protein